MGGLLESQGAPGPGSFSLPQTHHSRACAITNGCSEIRAGARVRCQEGEVLVPKAATSRQSPPLAGLRTSTELPFGTLLHSLAMFSFPFLLKNIWLAWHLS